MSWCFPPRPCVVFLACAHLALFLALSLSPLFPRGVTIVCMFAYYSAFWEQNLTDVLDIELSHIAIELGPLKFFNETKRPAVPLQQTSLLARLRAAVFIVRRREKLHRCEDVWSWLLILNVMGLLYTRRGASCVNHLVCTICYRSNGTQPSTWLCEMHSLCTAHGLKLLAGRPPRTAGLWDETFRQGLKTWLFSRY